MSSGTIALELNDAGLLVVADGVALGSSSPGYAVVDGAEVLTGSAARSRARLTPRRTSHRFWHELDDTPLPRPFPRRWSHLDLVHRHLTDLRRELDVDPESVIAVTPGDVGPQRLARLLGVAAAAGWPISGLVDAGVAAVFAAELEADRVWYLDLGLHRAVATELSREGGVARERVLVAADGGLVELERTWSRFFARRLVQATRFDALHSAASEQRLYDAMGAWLGELRDAESAVIALGAGGREHQVEISSRELRGAAEDIYQRILGLLPADVEPGSTRVVLSSRAARLPGLREVLEAVAGPPVELPPAAAGAGALAAGALILSSEGDPSFTVRLPARKRGAA